MNTPFQMQLLNFDPLLKLQVVVEVLEKRIQPVPTRPTIVAWLDEGILEGKKIGRGGNWYVYQSSLQEFIDEYCQPRQQKLAA